MSSTNGTLKLLSVQEGDEGSYQCVVANAEDTAQGTAYLWLGGRVTHCFDFHSHFLNNN